MAEREPEQHLLGALQHPLRQHLLRRLLASAEMLSPKDLAALEDESLSLVSYHVRVLASLGAIEIVNTEQVRGALQHYYLPSELAKRSPSIRAALGMEEG